MALKEAALCVKCLLSLVFLWAFIAVHNLGLQWERTITDVDVYTVQDPHFWGPVTMLVPNNCSFLMSKLSPVGTSPPGTAQEVWQLPIHLDAQSPPETVETNLLGHPILPAQDVVNFVAVQKCGHTIEAPNVTWAQYYFSAMSTASTEFTIASLHTSRMRLFAFFGVCVLSSQVFYIWQFYHFEFGSPFEQLAYRPSLLSELNHGVTNIISQFNLISLFMAFWVTDHYIMNYFPGRAYVIMVLFVPVLMCAQLCAVSAAQQNSKLVAGCCGLASACAGLYMCVMIWFPLTVGFSIFNLQFIFTMSSHEFAHEVDPSIQDRVDHIINYLVIMNILDMVVSIVAAKAQRPPRDQDVFQMMMADPQFANAFLAPDQ